MLSCLYLQNARVTVLFPHTQLHLFFLSFHFDRAIEVTMTVTFVCSIVMILWYAFFRFVQYCLY